MAANEPPVSTTRAKSLLVPKARCRPKPGLIQSLLDPEARCHLKQGLVQQLLAVPEEDSSSERFMRRGFSGKTGFRRQRRATECKTIMDPGHNGCDEVTLSSETNLESQLGNYQGQSSCSSTARVHGAPPFSMISSTSLAAAQHVDVRCAGRLRMERVHNLRFTHDTINERFADGRSLEDLVEALKEGRVDPRTADFLCLDVVRYRGKLYSLRNRRLWCLKEYQSSVLHDIMVRVQEHKLGPIAEKFVSAFTSENDGACIRVRVGTSTGRRKTACAEMPNLTLSSRHGASLRRPGELNRRLQKKRSVFQTSCEEPQELSSPLPKRMPTKYYGAASFVKSLRRGVTEPEKNIAIDSRAPCAVETASSIVPCSDAEGQTIDSSQASLVSPTLLGERVGVVSRQPPPAPPMPPLPEWVSDVFRE